MALRPIVKYPDPVLHTRAQEVSSVDAEVHRLVGDMIETMHAAPGVGLAANQVGVLLRVAVVDHKAIDAVKAAAAGIRARRFDPTPSWGACRHCAYNQICPFTATRE
jgi:peptide deformylase